MWLFPYEMRKMANKRAILVLFFVFLFNLFLFYNHISSHRPEKNEEWDTIIQEESGKQPEAILQEWNKQYRELEVLQLWIYDLLESPTEEQQKIIEAYSGENWIAETEKLENRKSALEKRIFQYTTILVEYPQFLEKIEENYEKMEHVSVFSDKDSYSYRNIKKTVDDFKKLGKLNLQPFDETGFFQLTRYYITDIFIIILIGFGCIQLLDRHKNSTLTSLVFSTKRGKKRLLLAQMESIVVWTILVSFIFYGSNIIVTIKMFQIDQWDIALQSMDMFRTVAFPWTIGIYLLLYLLWKTFAAIVTAALIILLCVIFGGGSLVWSIYGGIVGIGFLLWRYVPIHPILSMIRFLNPFGVFDCYQILSNYQNLNLFGYPFSLMTTAVVYAVIIIILGIGLSFLFFGKVEWNRRKTEEDTMRKGRYTTHLLLHEWYKIFVEQRGWIIIVVAVAFMLIHTQRQKAQYQFDEYVYNNYIKEYTGSLNAEKEKKIEKERRKIDSAPEQFSDLEEEVNSGTISQEEYKKKSQEIEKIYAKQKGFEKFYNQYLYLKSLDDLGIKGSFVNVFRTDELFFNNTQNYLYGMEYIVLMILILGGIFEYESKYGMMKLIYATSNGERKFFKYKIGSAAVIGMLLMGTFVVPQCYSMIIGLESESWNASIQSMEQMKMVLLPLTIKQYTIGYICLQLLSGALIGIFISFLAQILKRQFITIAAGIVVLLFPMMMLWMFESAKGDIVFTKFIGEQLLYIFYPIQSLFAFSTVLANGYAWSWIVLPVILVLLSVFIHQKIRRGES